jgi:glyoxalase family protein
VNQDDVSAYHLCSGVAIGTPGSDITFFDWPVPPEQRGTRSIIRTHLRVHGANTLDWWKNRLSELGIAAGPIEERDGRLTLDFEDPEGQRLALIEDGGWGEWQPWHESPVPPEHQIRGLGPIRLSVPVLAPTDALLRQALNMKPLREYPLPENPHHLVHVYEMGPGGPGAELHVAVEPNTPMVHPGAGGVHHVAFRTPDRDYDAWADRLKSLRIANSGKVDRYWFHSLYFREPNGILFEIATEGPGFTADEHASTLGQTVSLPPFLEPERHTIVANLKPID